MRHLAAMLLAAIIVCSAAGAQDSVREPLISPPLVFSSSQVKYGLFQNYLHRYMDRPLFMDKATRDRDVLTDASFHKIMGHAKMYGLDGLSILIGTPGMVYRYERALEAVDTSGRDDFIIMPRIGVAKDITYLDKTLTAALASPHSLRVQGQLLCGTYHTDGLTPEELATMLADLRAIHGDSFLYMAAVNADMYDALRQFQATGAVAEETAEAIKARWRSYLDVADGLVSPSVGMMRRPDRGFDADFYANFVVPTITGVLSEPGYEGKYLEMMATTGYYNFMSGSTLLEEGTKTLRRSFEIAMSANPDVIDMPEWDELNEHTCIEPTITNGLTTQRIINYYTHILNGEAPAPNEGDDTSIPNLVVSYRKALTLGEVLQIELLNIPDGTQQQPYQVAVTLTNDASEPVRDFDPVTLDPGLLADQTLALPTEEIAGEMLLRPRVTVRMPDGRELAYAAGLHHITLRPTDNWDYKWVKQPVRDILRPNAASFAVLPSAGTVGSRHIVGHIECDEPLAFVEVLENSDEIYGVDPASEYPDAEDQMLLKVTMRAMQKQGDLKGSMWLEGPPATIHTKTDGRYHFNQGDRLEMNTNLSVWPRGTTFSFAREQAERATVVLDFGILKKRIPVRNVLRYGVWSETEGNGVTVTLEDFRRLPDITSHVDAPSADIDFSFTPLRPHSIFHMRAIAKSGRIYRSAPVMVAGVEPGELVDLDVYSDSQHKRVTVQVPAGTIPDLNYDLDPENGSLLYTNAGRSFWGQIGGRTVDVTGRGGGESGSLGDPFRNGGAYPADAPETAPVYVDEDDALCLKFDGVGNYLVFPREMTPRRGAWTLSVDIKPTSDKKQTLFTHYGHYTGSVTIWLEGGEIHAKYTDQYLNTSFQNPGLAVAVDQWAHIEVHFDLETMTISVNDQTSEAMPATGPGLYIGTSVFGGHGGGTEYFEGYLKALRMQHQS